MKKKFVALKTFVFLQRRYGRAVDRGGLENRYSEMYRGVESLCLRWGATRRWVAFYLKIG